MLEWVNRDMLLDVSINVVPIVIMAFFIGLLLLQWPVGGPLLVDLVTQTMLVVPMVVLAFATYWVARAIERDALRSRGEGR